MKKKILVTLSLACIAAFSLGAAACDKPEDTEKPAQHSHKYQWVDNGNGTHKQHCAVDGCDAPDISSGDHDFTNGDCVCGAKPAGHVHTPLEAVKENVVQPTLESEGGYDLVVRCSECGEVISTEHVNLGKLELTGTELTSKTLNKEGDRLYAKLPNGTETFRFAGDITVAEGATWLLCTDILGTQVIPTKIAPLETGDNTFYLVVTNGNSDPMTYTVTLRVRPFYTVTFDANGGNTVPSQQIEEDDTLEELTADGKTGYTFSHWESDGERVTFPYTVTEDTTLTAEYTANTYTVTLDVNGGDELNKTEYETVYDSAFTLATPTRTGYTFDGWYDGANKITDTEWKYTEDKTFTACWSVNSYEIALQKEITTAGAVTGAGAYNYGTQATVTAETYLGYDFAGWYDGSALVSEDLSFTVTVGAQNKTYTAKWEVWDEYSKFEFTSDANTATITGIKDKTVTEIVIPDCVTRIDSYAFGSCNSLTSIAVSDNNTDYSSQDGMLFNKKKTELIYIPKGIKGAVIIPDTIKMLQGSTSFWDRTGVTSITISENVSYIESGTFYGCTNLETVYWNAIDCDSTGSYKNPMFENCDKLTTIVIGENVTGSVTNCFMNCSNLKTVYWNAIACEGAGSTSYPLFKNCANLTTVVIGDKVKSMSQYTFYDCSGITDVYYTGDIAGWCGISGLSGIMSYGASDKSLYIGGQEITGELIIPDNVTSIPHCAFSGCGGLTSITIPNSVTSIGTRVFSGCVGLATITFNGTKAQWNAVKKDILWNASTGEYTIHCTDGDIAKN